MESFLAFIIIFASCLFCWWVGFIKGFEQGKIALIKIMMSCPTAEAAYKETHIDDPKWAPWDPEQKAHYEGFTLGWSSQILSGIGARSMILVFFLCLASCSAAPQKCPLTPEQQAISSFDSSFSDTISEHGDIKWIGPVQAHAIEYDNDGKILTIILFNRMEYLDGTKSTLQSIRSRGQPDRFIDLKTGKEPGIEKPFQI